MYQAKNYDQLVGMDGLSESLLKNHFILYQGYVKHLNSLIEKIPDLGESQEFDELKRRFGWEWNGMRMHELYFENLMNEPVEEHNVESALHIQLGADFGSHPNWEEEIRAMAKIRGNGWVVLYFDKQQNRLFNVWVNEHDAGHLIGCEPIVVIDLWEHAYMLDYGAKKDDYVNKILAHLNWTVIEERFAVVK